MTNQDPDMTRAGLAGKIAGKAKEVAGTVFDNNDLAREGRLQQAQVDAESEAARLAAEARQSDAESQLAEEQADTEAERRRLQSQVASGQLEEKIQHDRQQQVDAALAELAANADAERTRVAQRDDAKSDEQRAQRERIAAAAHQTELESQAQHAEKIADAIDPEETR